MPILLNIQSLRGFAALAIVFHHLSLIEQKYSAHQVLPQWLTNTGMIGIDLFFMISGFIMVAVCRNRFDESGFPAKFLARRAIRIYPLYWLFSLVTLAVFLLQPAWVNSSQGNQVDWLSSIFLTPSEILPLLSVGWTLIHEMYFYLVFTVFLVFIREKYLVLALVGWAALIILFNIKGFSISNPWNFIDYGAWQRLVFNPMTLEFIVGALVALIYFSKIPRKSIISILVLASVFATYYRWNFVHYLPDIAHFANPKEYKNAGDWARVGIFAVPSLIILCACLYLETKKITLGKLWQLIGDSSYSLYLSHILVLSAFGKVWQLLSTGSIWENYIVLPVIILTAILFGLLSFRYIETPLINFAKQRIK